MADHLDADELTALPEGSGVYARVDTEDDNGYRVIWEGEATVSSDPRFAGRYVVVSGHADFDLDLRPKGETRLELDNSYRGAIEYDGIGFLTLYADAAAAAAAAIV